MRLTTIEDGHDFDAEVDKHVWADALIPQTPCNWMGVRWTFKKYMNQAYTDGMDGRLCTGDGRTREPSQMLPIMLKNTPRCRKLRSVRSSEKSVKL